MAPIPPAPPVQQRLSEQLRALSEVSEVLTIRLLELEERLQRAEQHLEQQESGAQVGPDGSGSTGEVLAQTEARIARLEEWLQGHPAAAVGPGPSVLPFPKGESNGEQAVIHQGDFGVDPFPQEEEQHFMDELSA
jgi:hypothetical protein